jgi:mevalonate pyrophosphate decarboxylase
VCILDLDSTEINNKQKKEREKKAHRMIEREREREREIKHNTQHTTQNKKHTQLRIGFSSIVISVISSLILFVGRFGFKLFENEEDSSHICRERREKKRRKVYHWN